MTLVSNVTRNFWPGLAAEGGDMWDVPGWGRVKAFEVLNIRTSFFTLSGYAYLDLVLADNELRFIQELEIGSLLGYDLA